MIETIFIIDLLINFRTTYISDKSGLEITDSKSIAITYLKGWFIVDFISILPYDQIREMYIKSNLQNDNKAIIHDLPRLLKALRLFKMAKVIKILKVRNYLFIK